MVLQMMNEFTLHFKITTVDEAKQFYPLSGLGENVALIFSGRTVKFFSKLHKNLPPGVDAWAISLRGMMGIVVLLGFVICAIYWSVNTFILTDPAVPKPAARKKKKKLKLGVGESMKFFAVTEVKGKAAIDVVCNPLGKSGGALIQQFMILTFGSLANSTPYLGGIVLVIVLGWIAAARSLYSQFTMAKEELVTETKKTSESDANGSAYAESQENSGNGSFVEII